MYVIFLMKKLLYFLGSFLISCLLSTDDVKIFNGFVNNGMKYNFLMRCEAKHFCSPMRTHSVTILSMFFAVTKSVLYVAVTAHQKIFVQTRDENIEIKSLPSVFRSFLECFVHLQ